MVRSANAGSGVLYARMVSSRRLPNGSLARLDMDAIILPAMHAEGLCPPGKRQSSNTLLYGWLGSGVLAPCHPDYATGFPARVESAMTARFSLRSNSPSHCDESLRCRHRRRKASETLDVAVLSGRSRSPAAYSGCQHATANRQGQCAWKACGGDLVQDSGDVASDAPHVVQDSPDVGSDAPDVVQDSGEVVSDEPDVVQDSGDVVQDSSKVEQDFNFGRPSAHFFLCLGGRVHHGLRK